MRTTCLLWLWAGAVATAAPSVLAAQAAAPEGGVSTKATAAAAPRPPLRWPSDQDRVIARVHGEDVTFGDLVRHVKERHDPLFDRFVESPGGARCFTDDRYGTDWVRQYADVRALMQHAAAEGRNPDGVEPHLSAALKEGFQTWLAQQSMPAEPSQRLIDHHLSHYQRYFGLRAEVRGWLDFLVGEDATEAELRRFYHGNARLFGGTVTFAHILVRHRDPITLQQLGPKARQGAWERIADLRARLAEDGSNFEDLAAEYSDDRQTGLRGGVFERVARFHPTLPAVLCRTAWRLDDGAVSDVVESPYGLHLVKRIDYLLRATFLFTPAAYPEVQRYRRDTLQEDLLFGLREKLRVKLLY
ncbi:MAG: peptidylprolyl isomerase [Planctomycetota bacterium]